MKIEFYTVYSWMRDDLELSGTELDCYAVIYCLSQGDNRYIAGVKNLMQLLHKSEPTIISALKSLTEKKLVVKEPVLINKITHYYYKAIKPSENTTKEILGSTLNNLSTPTLKNLSHTNNINIESKEKENKKLSNDNSKGGLDFDSFYKLYPLKRSRKAAEKAWGKLSVKDKKEAIKKLPAYIADCYMQKRKFQYPATYLNGATWNDDFSDSYEEEVNEEIPEERLEGWHRSQDWMNKAIPRIAGKIGFKDFDTMRGTVYHNRGVFSEILHEINNSDYEGDIVAEFCRLAQTERYNQKIFGV